MKRFQWKWILQGVRHAAPYCDHFGLLWRPFWIQNYHQNTKILRFGRNLVLLAIDMRVKNWALIISCYVLTLFFIHTTSTCIVRLGDICNALHYSNQYFILQFKASDYPFGVFKFFLMQKWQSNSTFFFSKCMIVRAICKYENSQFYCLNSTS